MKNDPTICAVPRWQILKAGLNNLDYDDFVRLASNDPEAIILDVRTDEEFVGTTIPNAINLNYLSTDLADQIEALDISKHYYVYCRTGRRSIRICVLMKNSGFKHVYNLDSGLNLNIENKD